MGSEETSPARHVVLLHGLGRTRFCMFPLARHLQRAGYTAWNIGYPSLRKPIDWQVERLLARIRFLQPANQRIDFVCHSLGGIIVRKFAALHGEHFSLGRCVMLGPPNQGSALAGKIARIPGSSIFFGPALNELKELDIPSATDKLEIGIIAGGTGGPKGFLPTVPGDNDGIVGLGETYLQNCCDWIRVPVMHTTLMLSPEVTRETLHFLEHGRFRSTADRSFPSV